MRRAFLPETTTPDRAAARRPAILAVCVVLVIAALIPVYRLQELSWPEAVAAAMTFVVPCVLLG
jgi:hypothetical protein